MAEWRMMLAKLLDALRPCSRGHRADRRSPEKSWRLGATGWFTGGTLVGVLALVVLADQYFESRKQS